MNIMRSSDFENRFLILAGKVRTRVKKTVTKTIFIC